jgi:hypothetical protein
MKLRKEYWIRNLILLLLVLPLTACGAGSKDIIPTQEPPKDMVPGYLPVGFEYDKSIELIFSVEDGREPSPLFSPSGNSTTLVHYIKGDEHLCIHKSIFPDGSLEKWLEIFQDVSIDNCECFPRRSGDSTNLSNRLPKIVEKQTIEGIEVQILEGPIGWMSVYVKDNVLMIVEGTIPLEENLKVVTSLLKK